MQKNQLIPSIYCSSKNPAICLSEGHFWLLLTTIGCLRCFLPLMIIAKQTIKISIDSFQRYFWSKNPATWFDERAIWPHLTKVAVSDTTFPWWATSCKKSKLLIDSYMWWSKNPAVWLGKKIKSGGCRGRLHERNWFTSRPYQKSTHSFTCHGKIVNSSINKTLNYKIGLARLGELAYFARTQQFTSASHKQTKNLIYYTRPVLNDNRT